MKTKQTTIQRNIKFERNLREMSQKDLAEKIGKTRGLISQYESGKTRITVSSLEVLAEAFKISIERLLAKDVEPYLVAETRLKNEAAWKNTQLNRIEKKVDHLLSKLKP